MEGLIFLVVVVLFFVCKLSEAGWLPGSRSGSKGKDSEEDFVRDVVFDKDGNPDWVSKQGLDK